MAADDFFARWSKQSKQVPIGHAEAGDILPGSSIIDAAGEPATPVVAPMATLPTMNDVSRLTHDSDYSPFVAHGVDETVKRSAMKKLFSNPHFNIMDGLDTYIEDYHTFEPISPEMLGMLTHAKSLLDPLGQLEKPLMELLTKTSESDAAIVSDGELNTNEVAAEAADISLPDEATLTSDAQERRIMSDDFEKNSCTTLSSNAPQSAIRPADTPARASK